MRPLLSVCILAYDRAALLPALLESVVTQDFDDWECIVAEDDSSERTAIRAVVEEFQRRCPGKIRYHENAKTLGYDGNFRQIVALAAGKYVLMMGNDDLLAPGALRAVADCLARHGEIGMILRAFAFFTDDPARPDQVSRYYPAECRFSAGPRAILACYRRMVVVSGIVINRDAAHAAATDRWDGQLFYQHWLIGAILARMDAVYLPDILVLYRRGGMPLFGKAEAERDRFAPGHYALDGHVKLVRALLEIGDAIEVAQGVKVAQAIRADFARYFYHTLERFAELPAREFWRAYRTFGALGFDRSPWFHFWYVSLAMLGRRRMEAVIQGVRRVIGHTPNLTRAARPD